MPLAVKEKPPRRTCQRGSDHRQNCPSCVALCEYPDREADAEIEMIRNQQRPRRAMILSAGSSSSSPLSELVRRVRPVNFDDIAPSERPPVATSLLPPIPPPLPPPAPAPTNVVSVGVEPKLRGEASVIISMADGSYARHCDDDSLTMLLLSQRDSATAEMVSKAMEDGLHDGILKSGNDTS